MKFIPFYHLTITINVAATKITRSNTMHKNTKCIPGNPSQQGKKTQPNPLLYSSRETFGASLLQWGIVFFMDQHHGGHIVIS
jgi:hypothetical protein